jgi:hypothetical protein
MTARIMFYVCMLALGAAFANTTGPNNGVELFARTLPIAGLLAIVVAAATLTTAWWMAWNFLADFSDRDRLATEIVGCLVNPGSDGQPNLPQVRSVGKRSFSLTELYEQPDFRMAQRLIQIIGSPCRVLFTLVSAGQ